MNKEEIEHKETLKYLLGKISTCDEDLTFQERQELIDELEEAA